MFEYDKKLKSVAQHLRREMTPEEKHLWYDFLKKLPITVKRQKTINRYILDFYITSSKIAIEIDGRQHKTRDHIAEDAERDKALAEMGISVLRYSNEDIRKRFNTIANDILSRLGIKASELNFNKKI